MSYETAIARIYALGHELAQAPSHKFDLAHMRVLLGALERPERRFPGVLRLAQPLPRRQPPADGGAGRRRARHRQKRDCVVDGQGTSVQRDSTSCRRGPGRRLC